MTQSTLLDPAPRLSDFLSLVSKRLSGKPDAAGQGTTLLTSISLDQA